MSYQFQTFKMIPEADEFNLEALSSIQFSFPESHFRANDFNIFKITFQDMIKLSHS